MLNLRENSGLLMKFNLSLDMPVAYPALSKYSETISKKDDSPVTLKLFLIFCMIDKLIFFVILDKNI